MLAVDVSLSMAPAELKIQRDGYAEAIVSEPVLDAIRHGARGRIAVAYVEWAGAGEQRVIAGWTMIDGPSAAEAFAARLRAAPHRRLVDRTSISRALVYSARQIDRSGFRGDRQAIDVSGDGPNNEGEAVAEARASVLAKGITINGLPLVMNQPSHQIADIGSIDVYYRDCVVGGPGAFVLPVTSIEQFKEAIRTKLVSEIAGLSEELAPPPSREIEATPAAVRTGPAAVCEGAEELWRKRYDK